MRRRCATAAAALLLTLAARPASAALVLQKLTTALAPVYITHAGDQRLFIVEQAGRIRIFDRGGLLPGAFLDIRSKVLSGGEQGLFSVAFHPDYASNGFFYVDYTNLAGDTVIERYKVTADPNVADAGSGVQLLLIDQPFANHNGGQLQVGPRDGYLYIGMGDGGSGGDPSCFAQRTDSLLGKMLRLDIRKNPSVAPFYGIPADNPFIGARDPANLIPDEIWALGLRNPWRFSFDRAGGDLYIGDVGQDAWEEVDLIRQGAAGVNLGWKVMEGAHCFGNAACPASTPVCGSPALALPIHEYGHASGCSIIGGYVYRGHAVAELLGRYVFGDYCTGDLRGLLRVSPGNWQSQPLLTGGFGLTTFGEDADGELYVAINGTVFKLVSDSPPPPVPASPSWGLPLLAVGLVALGAGRRRRAAARTP